VPRIPVSGEELVTVVGRGDVWEDVCPPEKRFLSDEHRRVLVEGSVILPEIIEERGYHTLNAGQVTELVQLEVVSQFALKASGWMSIPIWRPDGRKHGEVIRLFGGETGRKYIWPSGERLSFDVHPSMFPYLLKIGVDAAITEGIKKADALLSAARREGRMLLTIAANGCEGWRVKMEGQSIATPDYLDIGWEGRRVYIVSDSDYRTNDDVARGWSGCAAYTASKTGQHKTYLVIPPPNGREKQGADDYLVAGHSLEDLLGLAQTPRHANFETEDERIPLRLKTATELMREAGNKIPYLIEPLLPEKSIMLVAGHSGTFKTWAMLSMALDGAFGFRWLNNERFEQTAPFTTLYVNKEMSGIILGQRLKMLARAKRYTSIPDWEKTIEERIIFVDEAALDLNVPAQRLRLEEAIAITGARLIVLDSLSMSWHGDENSSTEVGAFYTELRGITERVDCSWGLVHHLLKPSSNARKSDPIIFSVRGSGQLIQQADAALIFAHYTTDADAGEKLISMTHAKARTDVELPAWVTRFSLNDGLFASMTHLCSLADAKAKAYAHAPENTEKLESWMLEEMIGMPALKPLTGSGLRSKPLMAFLQQSWTIDDKSAPSESTLRRQIEKLVEIGRLDVLEENKRTGNLYRLREPTDDEPESPPAHDETDPA
jgi:hypothetical protein